MSGGSTITIHMAASLDFFIAAKDGSFSWLETSDTYDKGVKGEDPEEFVKTIGCYVMGSRTFETALTLGWPYGDTPTYVLTHRNLPAHRDSVRFRSGDLRAFVADELRPRYKSIWVVGGAALARDFILAGLADELRITILPVLLGDGTPFVALGQSRALHLQDVTAYKNGLVELKYEIRK